MCGFPVGFAGEIAETLQDGDALAGLVLKFGQLLKALLSKKNASNRRKLMVYSACRLAMGPATKPEEAMVTLEMIKMVAKFFGVPVIELRELSAADMIELAEQIAAQPN